MKILVVSPDQPVTGDATPGGTRTGQLTDALLAAGHEISQAWLDPESSGANKGAFRNADGLSSVILAHSPDVILVTRWDLASLLPFGASIPVILDMAVMPSPEEFSQSPGEAGTKITSLRNALGRCDLVIVSQEKQKERLLYSMVEAGLDLSSEIPVIIIPRVSERESEKDLSFEHLLEWLDEPRQATRLEVDLSGHGEPPELGVPPLRERIARQWRLLRQFVLPGLIGLGRPTSKVPGQGVIIVTRGDLFPPDHGAAVRTLETAHALARQGCRVGLVTDSTSHWFEINPEGMTKHRVPWRTRLLGLPSPLVRLLHHSKNIPHSNSFLYLPLSDGSWYWRILAANKVISASVLQAEFPAYAKPCLEAAQALACGVVLVEHNVEYQRMKDQVHDMQPEEFDSLKAIELDLCRRSDAVVCVSDNDRRKLIDDGIDPARLHTIPHGVDLSAGENPPEPGVRERFGIGTDDLVLVYHGTFSYPPNREVLGIFANEILPGLEALGIRAHVLAVGRDAPPSAPHQRIHFTGSVLNVGPWLRVGDIAVVPLTDGGGTRMKILDYFAAALPVVSTGKGIEGIPASHGEEALIIDEWPAFIEAISGLWRDKEKAAELGRNGRVFAESLSWDEIGKQYLRLFGMLDR